MSSNRLSGDEHKDEFLQAMGFSTLEIERIRAIRARPRDRGQQKTFELPRLYSEYKNWQKTCFAEVFGDAAAETIFGAGPWLKSERSRLSFERQIKSGKRQRPKVVA